MNISIEPGTYIVAVSGGVDSLVLLDLLVKQSPVTSRQSPARATGDKQLKTSDYVRLIVAHYDHGIRHDSHLDRELVQQVARQHGLPFVYDEGNLGDASEADARKARYDFLHRVRTAAGAGAIITAHHQDDLLETAILNLLRGTGRRGLTSLGSTDIIRRPLLAIPKQKLIDHAKSRGIKWHEDATNADTRYRRNHVRHQLLTKFSPGHKQKLLAIINELERTNREIDQHLANHLHLQPALDKLDRHEFIMLPHNLAREVMMAWLRRHDVRDITTQTLERLVTAAKTFQPGRQADVDRQKILLVKHKVLALSPRDR